MARVQGKKKKLTFFTSRFGNVEIEEERIITFIESLPGFSEARRFTLIPHEEDSPFFWMQSLDHPQLALILIDPYVCFPDYHPLVPEDDLSSLGIEDIYGESTMIYTVVTIPGDPHRMTVNLLAPIIINLRKRLAKQVVVLNDEYTTKHEVLLG